MAALGIYVKSQGDDVEDFEGYRRCWWPDDYLLLPVLQKT